MTKKYCRPEGYILDYCFRLGSLLQDLHREGLETDMFHDFDLHPSRRPKVLVQTAAHVAGAVQYLHKSILPQEIQEKQFAKKSVCKQNVKLRTLLFFYNCNTI